MRKHLRTGDEAESTVDPFTREEAARDRYCKQRLQQLFFPEGIAFDGNRFNRTAATAPLFNYLAPSESADEKMVSRAGNEPETETATGISSGPTITPDLVAKCLTALSQRRHLPSTRLFCKDDAAPFTTRPFSESVVCF